MMTPEQRIEAAELALGLLEGDERAAALRRVLADPEFAAELAWWRSKLDALFDDYDHAEPPAGFAGRLDDLITSEQRAVSPISQGQRWPWLIGGLAGGALAASLAIVMLTRTAPVPPSPPIHRQTTPLLVAALVPSKGQQVTPVAAVIDHDSQLVRIAEIAAPDGRVAELWRIGADGVPRSLGLLARSGATRLPIRPREGPGSGETLAISIEPLGGSPTGNPTGPVIATGVLTRG